MARNVSETIFTGNVDDLVAAWQQQREEARRTDQVNKELAQAQRSAHREEQQALRDAARMTREVQTPLEQYRQKVAEIEKAYESGNIDQETRNRQLQKQKELLDQNGNSADTFGSKMSAGVANFTKQIAGFAAGLVSVGGVIRVIRAEAEDFRRRNAEAFLANTDFGTVMRNTRQMFTADATVGDDDLLDRITQAATESRTSPKMIAEALAGVFSAKGQLSNETAIEAVTEAFRLTPNDLAAGSQLSSRALDISKQSGVEDIPAIIGFLKNVTSNARVESIDAVGQYGVPAINAIATRGDSLEEAGELFATINQLMSDAEGRLSKTAAINLSTKMAEFAPAVDAEAGVTAEQVAAYNAATSTTQRLAVTQSSPELAQQLLGKVSFDAASTAFIEKLVTGTDDALATQRAAAAGIMGLATPQEQAAQRANFEAEVAKLDAAPEQELLKRKQQADVINEVGQTMDIERGEIGQVRQQLEDTFNNVDLPGPDWIGRKGALMAFDARTDDGMNPAEAGILALEGTQTSAFGSLSAGDQEIFNEQLAVLRQIAAQQQQPVKVDGPAGPPPAAAQGR